MFTDGKNNNTNYGKKFIYCFFCLVFVVEVARFTKPYVNLQKLMETESVVLKEGLLEVEENSEVFARHFLRSVPLPGRGHKKVSGGFDYFRVRPPTTYCVKFESFDTLSKLVNEGGKYESRPFSVGGYNWTFLIYPDGNRQDGMNGYVSLYARIDNSSLISNKKEVYAEIKFFSYHRNEEKYYVFQDNEAQRFHLLGQTWGRRDFRPTGWYKDRNGGWIFDGDQCVFCIDIFVAQPIQKWEDFSYQENIRNPIFGWKLPKISMLTNEYYTSDSFSSGGRNWKLKVYPNGIGSATRNSLSLYLLSDSNESCYVQAKLRVYGKNQNTYEKSVEGWPNAIENGWGFDKFMSLAELKDTSKGFLDNDTLKVEVEIVSFSKTDSG